MDDTALETKGYEFYWRVAANGYSLFDDDDFRPSPYIPYEPDWIFFPKDWDRIDKQPPLLAVNHAKKDKFIPDKIYKPLSNLCLHRKFASLRTEDLEIEGLRFANKYGLLAQPMMLTGAEHEHHNETVIPYVSGESLFRWRRSIDQMGVLLAIWDWVERKEAGKLGQIILWPSSDTVKVSFKWKSQKGRYEISARGRDTGFDYGVVEESLFNYDEPHSPFAQFRMGDVIGPARYYLSRVLNYHLQGVTPHLVPMTGYEVAFMPKTLLDALWLMFMLEVAGTQRTCWHCRGPLIPTRKDNVYCSNKCKRMAYYYAKQRKEANYER